MGMLQTDYPMGNQRSRRIFESNFQIMPYGSPVDITHLVNALNLSTLHRSGGLSSKFAMSVNCAYLQPGQLPLPNGKVDKYLVHFLFLLFFSQFEVER